MKMQKLALTLLPLLIGMAAALSVGCQSEDPIIVQRIPKAESGYQALRNRSRSSEVSEPDSLGKSELQPEEITDRMIVAVYPLESAMWFFKLNGTIAEMENVETPLIQFFENVQFVDGNPKWELPENWSEGSARPMRFATLMVGGGPKSLELAISSLPAPQDLLLNVNRWLDQMSLSKIDSGDLGRFTKPLNSSIEGALVFDVSGRFGGGMMASSRGLASVDSSAERPRSSTISNSSSSRTIPRAQKPTGWGDGPTNAMVPIRYQKEENDRKIQISIIPLPAAANEWEPNVNRWAGEVELSELSPEEFEKRTSAIEVDGIEGKMIRLIPHEDSNSRGTIAAMIKQADVAWFIKLSGDKQLVLDNESAFQDFLGTVKLPPGN